MLRRALLLPLVALLFTPALAAAQGKPIKVGFPIILSGGGALFGAAIVAWVGATEVSNSSVRGGATSISSLNSSTRPSTPT